jgi:hypothetical protein
LPYQITERNISYHKVEDCMGFEEDDISAAELATMFKNTENSDKADTGDVV